MMHLAHPGLTTTGKKRGKIKWRSAEEKRKFEEQEAAWQKLLVETSKLGKPSTAVKIKPKSMPAQPQPFRRSTNSHIPSIDDRHTGAVSSKPNQQYTGNNVCGIAVQHKSCLQPIFNQQEAIDSAKMRRG